MPCSPRRARCCWSIAIRCRPAPRPCGAARRRHDRRGAGRPLRRLLREDISAFVEDALQRHGLRVLRNKPYAGGFITQNHGAPHRGQHALQIEINRSLYMNEATLEKTRDFWHLQDLLGKGHCHLARRSRAPLRTAAPRRRIKKGRCTKRRSAQV